MKKKYKNLIIASSIVLLSLPLTFKNRSYNPKITIIEESDEQSFGTYSNGTVYIGTEEEINSIKDKVNPEDILIYDERDKKDPNFKILDSYRITSPEERNEILLLLEEYEKLYPSKWNRTLESLRNEWEIHNILYNFNFQLNHTTDVDLNNLDEIVYKSKYLTKLLDMNHIKGK